MANVDTTANGEASTTPPGPDGGVDIVAGRFRRDVATRPGSHVDQAPSGATWGNDFRKWRSEWRSDRRINVRFREPGNEKNRLLTGGSRCRADRI